MRKTTLITLLAVISTSSFAQKTPDWVLSKPVPENNTYLYQIEWGVGSTERDARKEAFARVFQYAAALVGQPFNSAEINRAVQNGTDYSVISEQYNIPINKVCEYTEKLENGFRVYILCQVARAGNIAAQWTPFSCPNDNINKVYAKEALYVDGCEVYRNGESISESELKSMFANSKSYYLYDKGIRQYNAFKNKEWWEYSLAGFSVFACTQCAWLGLNDDEKREIWKIVAITGASLTVASFIVPPITKGALKAAGKKKIRKAVDLYNNGRLYSQSDMNLKFGMTGNGICMSLSF